MAPITLRAVVIDDEVIARRRLCRLLRHAPDVAIVGECADGASAVETIRRLTPDVVFLDVQMPELDGFQVLQALATEEPPLVIFVTAYDEYAVRAFEVNAVDYLVKPVMEERLMNAVKRARDARDDHRLPLRALLSQLANDRRYLTRLPVRSRGRLVLITLTDVEWLEAADNYVTLHLPNRAVLVRATLASLERDLDPAVFVRVHRSAIVRIDGINELVPESHGDFTIVLKSGATLPMARGYRARLERALGRSL